MQRNETKFDGKAAFYAKYRPDYPQALIDYLYQRAGLTPQSIIADIGAGTGILTKLLAAKGSTVYAVEPNDEMRQEAAASLAPFRQIQLIRGTAEKTTLEPSSVDFVTVAQAFHWFDKTNFRKECRRILKSGGKIVLIWNIRNTESPLMRENDQANRQFCPTYQGFSEGFNPSDTHLSDFFLNGIFEHKSFPNNINMDEQEFIGRNLSSSYAPRQGTPEYIPYIDLLKTLFEKYEKNGTVLIPITTHSYIGKV